MNIADTSNYTIRVSQDIYYIKNKLLTNLTFSLYKQEKSLSLVSSITLTGEEEQAITFNGDGTYKVYIGSDIIEIRYYLQLQESLIISIGDFLCDCCTTTLDNCDCSTPIDVKCVQFSSIPLMLLSYQHLVDYCLNSCCSAQYLYDAANEYEYDIRESYEGHIQEECIKGKSLYGSRGLRFFTSFYYALFLEAELEARDSEDADFIYDKFDYDRIRTCMDDLGVNYDKLKEIMGLCDDRFTSITNSLESINDSISTINTNINSIEEDIVEVKGDIIDIKGDITTIAGTIDNCCDSGDQKPPVADAGADQIVDVDTTITLDGTDSYDLDGTIVTYLWEVVSSPVLPTITTPTTASTTVSGLSVEGTYIFKLTVIDDDSLIDIDVITVTVGTAVPIAENSIVNNNRAGDCTATYTFQESNFVYTPSGYTTEKIRIDSIASILTGTLEYNSAAITTPLEIDIANIGLLVYTPDNLTTAQYSEPFSFSVKTTENSSYSNSASMNIINTSCADTIAQIQLTTEADVNMSCGTTYILSGITGGDPASRQFKITNIGDLALAGTLSVSGPNASKFSLSTYVVNAAAGGSQTVQINATTLESDGSSTLAATITITTNSDINSTCLLNVNLAVAEVDAPPTTQNTSITVPRDTSCTDVYTFSSINFPYIDGSPVGRTHIRINSVPSTGILKYGTNVVGTDLGLPLTIAQGNIGLLTYTPDGTNQSSSTVIFSVESSNDNGSTWG